jgi:hypothetical protein
MDPIRNPRLKPWGTKKQKHATKAIAFGDDNKKGDSNN